MVLKASYKGIDYVVKGDLVEKAEKRPLDKERVIEALTKSGGYPYKLDEVIFEDFQDGFIRVASLNNLRRELFEKIMKSETSKYRRRRYLINEVHEFKAPKKPLDLELLVTCTTKEQLNTLIEFGVKNIGVDIYSREKDSITISDIKAISGINFFILTPEIIKSEFKGVVNVIEKAKGHVRGLITANAGIINIYKDKMNIIGDYKLNVFNSYAIDFYREDIGNISTELMVSEYCPIGSTYGGKNKDKKCNLACTRDRFTLVDEVNEKFRVMTDVFCRSHILNSVALNLIGEKDELKAMGIESFRIDFKDESREDVIKVFKMLNGELDIESKYYTKGCYRRGVD